MSIVNVGLGIIIVSTIILIILMLAFSLFPVSAKSAIGGTVLGSLAALGIFVGCIVVTGGALYSGKVGGDQDYNEYVIDA